MQLTQPVNKLVLLLCLVIVASVTQAQKVIKTDTSHYLTLHIDPSSANGGNASDVFEKINYIPLETTPESLFGSISQLEVVDDYFIILDENTACILLFNKSGKYHAKISMKKDLRRGRGPSNFYVNRFTKQIIYSDDSHRTLTYCDFNGKVLKVEDQMVKDLNPTAFCFISPTKQINCDMYRDYDSKDPYFKPFTRSLIQYVDDEKVYAMGFVYTQAQGKKETTHKGIGPLTYFGNDTTLFYSEYFNYRVNTVGPNSIKRAYQFIFPLDMALPADFNTNPVYNDGLNEYLEAHKDQIYCINNFYKVGNTLMFEACTRNYNDQDKNKQRNLIYNLKSGSLIAFMRILTDETSFLLPLYDGNFDFKGVLACDGQMEYNAVSSQTMFKANEDNKGKNVKYSPALTDYFSKGTKKDNPVIIQFKVKNTL